MNGLSMLLLRLCLQLGVILQLRGKNLYPESGQKQTFFDPLPPRLVHVVIEWPLVEINMYLSVNDDGISYWVMLIFVVFKEKSMEQVEIWIVGLTSDFEPKYQKFKTKNFLQL